MANVVLRSGQNLRPHDWSPHGPGRFGNVARWHQLGKSARHRRDGSVLDPHPDPERFDSSNVGVNDVHYENGLYWMWYFGGNKAINNIRGFDVKGFPMRSGAAISRDGINWTRIEGPYNGALLDSGKPGEFDAFMAAWPQVIRWDDGSWRLYYHTLDPNEGYVMAWAESEDGLRWEKRGPLLGRGPKGRFDDYGLATRQIIKINGQWALFY